MTDLEAILGHRFAKPELLQEALTHRSAARGRRAAGSGWVSNERLEFIGDRVLGLLIAEWLIERYPIEQEGALGQRLGQLVSQPVLAEIAETIGLGGALEMAPGDKRSGVAFRARVLADAVEATIGALYLDGGLDAARGLVRRIFEGAMMAQASPPKDAKTELQEWAQGRGFDLPAYRIASREGPSHAPLFEIEVSVAGKTGKGSGANKRAAEQEAAAELLLLLSS